MKRFFITAESLYGAKFLTLNSHLHLQLERCYKIMAHVMGFGSLAFSAIMEY